MKYLDITYPDVNNGSGLRVTLWLSGCDHCCYKCQNVESWNNEIGFTFDKSAKEKLFEILSIPYINGITFSGGDPLNKANIRELSLLVEEIRKRFPDKNIWLYTGYTWEQIFSFNIRERDDFATRRKIVKMCDFLIDGKFVNSLRDITLEWRGSSNQRVINVKETLRKRKIILWNNTK